MAKDLILFGVQGSGKGTQARFIAERYGMRIFEAGAELRAIVSSGTPLGERVREIIESGNLVSNELVMEIVSVFLAKIPADQRVLFDGLPRSMEQKASFDALLQQCGRAALGLFLALPRDEAVRRMLARGRSDDTEAAIKIRLENYDAKTLPVIEAYKAEGRLIEIDGNQPVEAVTAAILEAVEPASA
jgi:adenylate kinase